MLHFELQVYGNKAVANELRTAAAGMQRRVTNATYDWAMSRSCRSNRKSEKSGQVRWHGWQ